MFGDGYVRCKYLANDGLGCCLDFLQIFLALKAFGVDLVNILSAREPRRKPPMFGNNLNATDGVAIARCVGQNRQDFLARQIGNVYAFPGDLL